MTALALLTFLTGQAQQPGKHVYLPGKGHLDVEQFIKPIDTRMDISKLSLAELRVLRNAFAARQGFVLKDADLRHIFSQTSWYDSIVWANFDMAEEQMVDASTNDWQYFSGYTEYGQNFKLTQVREEDSKPRANPEMGQEHKPPRGVALPYGRHPQSLPTGIDGSEAGECIGT